MTAESRAAKERALRTLTETTTAMAIQAAEFHTMQED